MCLVIKFLTVFVILTGGYCLEDRSFWFNKVNADLEATLHMKHNSKRAKNIIIFIGDGMGPTTVTAARIYHKTETGKLSFEEFPHVGVIKTYSGDHIVPDSSSTATAMYTGVKVNQKTGGVDMSVQKGDCNAAAQNTSHLETVLTWAQKAGKATGFVTTTRITHATPMALYAKTADRDWECNSVIPKECQGKVKDIALQLIENDPGKQLRVIMGGGMQTLKSTYEGQFDSWTCLRSDNRSLIDEWQQDKLSRKYVAEVAYNAKDLFSLNLTKTDYLMGVFANGHMPYDDSRLASGAPSLVNMTEVALKILMKEKKGFFLMVEGGLIDQAHHRGKARHALNEAAIFSETIQRAQEILGKELDQTLLIVTADHAHGLTMSGYPKRNSSILGIAQTAKLENIPYTTLNYIVGGDNNYQFKVVDGKVQRADPSLNDTEDYEYSQQSAIHHDEGVHGGTDVYVYAKGPMAHLFHSLHEQPYIARVMAYAGGFDTHFGKPQASSALKNFGGLPLLLGLCLASLCYT